MKEKLSVSSYTAIGVMLFALFFGAGNLIFPAQLGQYAGENLWPAITGFLITGVGLPLLGIMAMSFSGSRDLQQLAGRVTPAYGIFFTVLLYLTIGPFFAAPRTGTVAFEVGIAPFLGEGAMQIGLLVFTVLFFAATLLFSLYPAKIVQTVGKFLAPGLVILLGILLITAMVNPMGEAGAPQAAYQNGAFVQGFLEGYNTMDALASLVFGIIVIKAIRNMGVTSTKGILISTAKSGLVAIGLLGAIYVGIAYLGASSVEVVGLASNGGPVLSSAVSHYFGSVGSLLLAVLILLACLTTAIGLTISCAEYFHTLLPRFSYRTLVIFFASITFIIANFGLSNIIAFSIPVLMFLYPLAIVLMLLAFLSPLFQHKQAVYMAAIGVTFIIALFDGLKALCDSLGIEYFSWMTASISFFERTLPLYDKGLGWLLPALLATVIAAAIVKIQKVSTAEAN
jgi:branched-chain amino acid:cation transporter, LIVCS family